MLTAKDRFVHGMVPLLEVTLVKTTIADVPRNRIIPKYQSMVFTGLRLQEMLDLELIDVNLDSQDILVRQGKEQKDRKVPIHPRLLPILRNYLAARKARRDGSQYFINCAKSGKPMSGKDVRTICQKLSRASGCYFTPHMLRHTLGRLTVESGWDIFKIKEVMGHSEITTTQGYLSMSTENIKRTFGDLKLL